jgi:16S rRNA U516 pseudouridylate synthase RsuA-like enzyme
MRIHKFLAQAGVCSRREAERLVAAGEVFINGKAAGTGQPVDPSVDVVTCRGQHIMSTTVRARGLMCWPAPWCS